LEAVLKWLLFWMRSHTFFAHATSLAKKGLDFCI